MSAPTVRSFPRERSVSERGPCYAIFAAFHVLCYNPPGICGIAPRCIVCRGVVRTWFFFRVTSNTLLLFYLTGAIFLSFQDQPVELSNFKLEFTSQKITCIARKCHDKVTTPGATLTSELICKQRTHLKEQLQKKVM